MTISAALTANGIHHAQALGNVTVGAGSGEVPAIGTNQLMTLPLPFPDRVYLYPGFEDQFYIISKSLDGNVTDVRLDAQQFSYVNGVPSLRLRMDVAAVPASVNILLEAHHSIGR
jgi:hypothetical protein